MRGLACRIGGGNILVWKRRAERYLIDSGLGYFIVHPGGLIDDAGGARELIVDVDDRLITSGGKYRRIPRADVAELCVQALLLPEAENRWVGGDRRVYRAGCTCEVQCMNSKNSSALHD
jgi:uncharacterized protein YbjT (DUF2867 family)